MVRTHGWGGTQPSSDDEAIERILEVASDAFKTRGADLRVADVARVLGVSRQTVYNYFPGNKTLLEAAATRQGLEFLEQLPAHLAGVTDPAEALVESLALTVEWLPNLKHIQVMLSHEPANTLTGITSEMAMQFGHNWLQQLDIDWERAGLDDTALEFLVELTLRTLQSFMIDPGHPRRAGADLRAYLSRCITPVIESETARGNPQPKPTARPRRKSSSAR